jgi:hypothetical protein
MRHPATVIPEARQFRWELETIYRIELPELDVPRGWLPRIELIVETLAARNLLGRTSVLAVREQAGVLNIAIEGPYPARVLVRRLAYAALGDCKICGGPLIDPLAYAGTSCARCPGGGHRAGIGPR